MFELILEHYYINYRIINGYAFTEGFNTKISEVTRRLYTNRQKFKAKRSDVQLVIKHMLNSMWSKSCSNRRDTSIVNIPYEQSIDKFINTNAYYIIRGINREFALMKPYMLQYTHPQFGCCVLSNAAVFISKIIYRAIDLGIELFYTNTDCLSMYAKDLKTLDKDMHIIGNDLGEFSYEVTNGTKFI
jgi:hypothetical protein